MRKKFLIGALLSALMLIGMISPAFAAGETVTTSMKGNDVTITVTDGTGSYTKIVQYAKNTTQTYEVGDFVVQVVYNGSGVKSATVVTTTAVKPPTPISNAPAPKLGVDLDGDDMTWNANDQAVAKGAFVQSTSKDKTPPSTALVPVPSQKLDASGDKIPSNAHSGDFPGIYFYWNDKQKDDGILKVDPALFNLFKDGTFVITAKNSNAYWDYRIDPDDKLAVDSDGYLLYQIPRYFMYTQANNKNGKVEEVKEELKNINMIFISGDYKDAKLIIDKQWLDEEGNLIEDADLIAELNYKLTFNAGLKLGDNTIQIDNFHDAYFGKTLTVTEGAIAGYNAKANPITVTVKWDQPGSIQFNNQKQYAHIKIDKLWDLISDTKAPDALFNIYDEDDNPVHEEVGPGTYPVKEGTYKVVEIAISGFTADQTEATITVDAGKTSTVSFKNVEDRASFTIKKNWEGLEGSGLTAEALNAKLTFGGYTLGKTYTVKAGSEIQFSEGFTKNTWTSADGKTRYTIEFISVSVDDATSDVNEVDLIANEGDNITITFTNKITVEDISACLNVRKVWLSKGDKTEAELNAMINFNPVLGKQTNLAPGQTIENIGESYIDGNSWLSADGKVRYTIVPVSVVVNGNHKVTSLTLEESSTNSIVFTNKVIWEDVSARLEVLKFWQGDLDGYTCNDLNARIIFTPGLGKSFNLKPGDTIKRIKEVLPDPWISDDGLTRYSIEQVCMAVDGHTETTSLTLAEKGRHTIVFVNKLVVEDISATLSVSKEWKSTGDKSISDLNNWMVFDPELGISSGWKPGDVVNISEDFVTDFDGSWLSTDGLTRYTIVPVSILVDGVETDSLTVAEKGEHTIVFVNKVVKTDISAKLNVTKVWLDTGDKTAEELNNDITFNPGLGWQHNVKPGEVIQISESFDPIIWDSEDGKTRYTVEQVSITVDGVDATTLVPAEKGKYSIVFTNTVTSEDITGSLDVSKVWQNTSGFDENYLNKKITFVPELGEQTDLAPGTKFNEIAETVNKTTWLSEDGKTRYTIEIIGVTVDGEAATSLVIGEGKHHEVIFTNTIIETQEYDEPLFEIFKTWINESGEVVDLDTYRNIGADIYANFSDGDETSYDLGKQYDAKAGDTINVVEDFSEGPVLWKSETNESVIVEFVDVTIIDQSTGATVINDATDGSVSFEAKGDGVYQITFTNRIVETYHPYEAVGKIFKGPENYYGTPKDENGDSKDANEYFKNMYPGLGRSPDTVYISVKYYDNAGKEKWTPEFWYPYVIPPTGSGDYFEFYVNAVDDDGIVEGYFILRLSYYNRSPSRPSEANSLGHWYHDVTIEYLTVVKYVAGEEAPTMVPPAPYDPGDGPFYPVSSSFMNTEEVAAAGFFAVNTPEDVTEDEVTSIVEDDDLFIAVDSDDPEVSDGSVDSSEVTEQNEIEEGLTELEEPNESLGDLLEE